MDAGVFEAHRARLFSLAYRMLGSAAEAEDVTQDAYLRARTAQDVRNPEAYLVTTVTRLAIDRLRSARRRRETYVGPWLPEPLVGVVPDAAEDAELAESLSFSFLVLLETLSPVERAAFLLRDVFDHPYEEVAAVLGRSNDACRQLVHRARGRIVSRRRRFDASKEKHDELLGLFLDACRNGNVRGLVDLLAGDVVLYTDGGGETRAARVPVEGADRVGRFLVNVASKTPRDVVPSIESVNGRAGIVLRAAGAPVATLALETTEGRVDRVYVVAAPSKLRRV